jgi:hypothetical protein
MSNLRDAYFNPEVQRDDLPKMPEGYYHLQRMGGCHVLMDTGTFMKKLKTVQGYDKRFDTPQEAAEYAHKHKAAGLKYDDEVTES